MARSKGGFVVSFSEETNSITYGVAAWATDNYGELAEGVNKVTVKLNSLHVLSTTQRSLSLKPEGDKGA